MLSRDRQLSMRVARVTWQPAAMPIPCASMRMQEVRCGFLRAIARASWNCSVLAASEMLVEAPAIAGSRPGYAAGWRASAE